ncbi:MAG: hypothetical protein ACTSY1_07840 [Alphaproteobacteria bacterium]
MSKSEGARGAGLPGRTMAFVVLAMFALSACSTGYTVSDLNPFGASEPPVCPTAGTLSDAASVTEFGRGKSRKANNVRYRAEISRSAMTCDISGNKVTGTVALIGEVQLGRKGKSGEMTLPIFVVLTIRNADVIDKRFETVGLTVPQGAKTAGFQHIVQNYTFDIAPGRKSSDYEILVGFNLTPEQIEYNRKQLAR